jgi:hypothetical protein
MNVVGRCKTCLSAFKAIQICVYVPFYRQMIFCVRAHAAIETIIAQCSGAP